jgi:alginate O-acetyltransferase complex protein AlgI
MLFNSLTFVAFFAIILAVHRLPLPWTVKKVNLLLASYLFYAAWNPPFVLLLWISSAFDWFATRRMVASRTPRGRRAWLVLSLVLNLGLLASFKYVGFVTENIAHLLALVGVTYRPPAFDILLPLGISFYTFQSLSYTIDVYRGTILPWPSFLDFALSVAFFPHMNAGPIVRSSYLLPQFSEPHQATRDQMSWGLCLVIFGLFAKMIADTIAAPVADRVYDAAALAGFTDAWVGTLAFSAQIFLDFSGYSLCAIGTALSLGFALSDNFRFPYAAIGFSDFWQRWHISLSSWLRDYLYVPLGGNRKGRGRTYVNLALTMLLGGLWHGASWRFVVWGGLHGVYLGGERWLRERVVPRPWMSRPIVRVALALFTYGLVCITWVFFRARDFATARTMLTRMLRGGSDQLALGSGTFVSIVLLTAVLLAFHWSLRDTTLEATWQRLPRWSRPVILAIMLCTLAFIRGADRAFIYFQF